MRLAYGRFALVLAVTIASLSAANAQTSPTRVVVSPAEPDAYQPFEIEFTALNGVPSSPINVHVSDGTITIEYGAIDNDMLPLFEQLDTTVEGISAGGYTIKIVRRATDGEMDQIWDPVSLTVGSGPAPQSVYAFYNFDTGHYFVTGSASERDAVLQGVAGNGWAISDDGFNAWPATGPAPDAARSVCRFYSPLVNSHFYTAGTAECEGLKQVGSGWTYEGIAFRALTPEKGACPTGTAPVWRLYNDRAAQSDSNHRFIASSETYRAMIAAGWAGEGIAFCSPN